MAKHSTSKHAANGKTYTTKTTHYNNGSSKSVTREGGGLFSSGKLTRVTHNDGRK